MISEIVWKLKIKLSWMYWNCCTLCVVKRRGWLGPSQIPLYSPLYCSDLGDLMWPGQCWVNLLSLPFCLRTAVIPPGVSRQEIEEMVMQPAVMMHWNTQENCVSIRRTNMRKWNLSTAPHHYAIKLMKVCLWQGGEQIMTRAYINRYLTSNEYYLILLVAYTSHSQIWWLHQTAEVIISLHCPLLR